MTISVAVLHALVMLGMVCFWWLLMDQNPEQGGEVTKELFVMGAANRRAANPQSLLQNLRDTEIY